MLEKIKSPADIRNLSVPDVEKLAREIRAELIRTVSVNGGHLASNLGVVELTLAIHRVFNTPEDQIVFDVGHQSYVHKMITGRYHHFSTLRTYGGISGFPKRDESVYDVFETGHASTAISAALGLARARDFQQKQHHVVALVGDGALTGGMCYEALNDAGNSETRLMVILNDNDMSIARNTGALSHYLTNLRVSAGWQSTKERVRRFEKIPVIGKPVYHMAHAVKTLAKSALMKDDSLGFFETLGFHYYGPIDGHDLLGMEKTLKLAKDFPGPCLIHVVTQKGFGYDQAELRPEIFHGTPPFYVETGNRRVLPDAPSNGHVMADTLAEMAETDSRIVTITAAMQLGTGLDHFAAKFPERMLDIGIAEEHAATMAAGLAAGGMRPYFAVYTSFFQRCHDQMIHDIAMQHLPVTFLLDRAGIGGEDGQTHHGIFDLASLLPVPGMTVLAPADGEELRAMLQWTARQNGPVAVRYAKESMQESKGSHFTPGRWPVLRYGKKCALLAVGNMISEALKCAEKIDATVINCSSLKPLDVACLRSLQNIPFFTMEEHIKTGGFGAFVSLFCQQEGLRPPLGIFALDDQIPSHGKHSLLLEEAGLTAGQMTEKIRLYLGEKQ